MYRQSTDVLSKQIIFTEYFHFLQKKISVYCRVQGRQRSGKGAIRKRFQLQKPRWEKTKLTIRHLYDETWHVLVMYVRRLPDIPLSL